MELAALLTHAVVAPLDDVGWIRVTGPDRVRWLNGMVTNSIQHLDPGEGCYNFLLNAQGRIQGDLTAFLLEDVILIETSTSQVSNVSSLLERFIIMDDVELQDWNSERAGIVVAGPGADSLLQATGFAEPLGSMQTALKANRGRLLWRCFNWKRDPCPVEVVHAYSPLVPRFELWSTPAIINEVRQALESDGAVGITSAALEQLRILEGTPRYGTDIRNSESARDLPQETGQTRALHFNKGCYLGQEIVERIRSRGHVHRVFAGFELTGPLPPAGTALQADAKTVGELTTVAAIDHPVAGPIQVALGYLRREALERSSPLTYAGGTAVPRALPYTRA